MPTLYKRKAAKQFTYLDRGGDGDGSKIAAAASSHPFPKLGLKLSAILEFVALIPSDKLIGMTTTQVCQEYLLPLTNKSKDSYCEQLKKQKGGSKKVGLATVFVSHAWKYLFSDVINTLKHYFQGSRKDEIIWFDLFSNNQQLAVDLDFDWWCGTFKSAIKEFGNFVLVLAPWQHPTPFTRAWCLFEIYCAITTGSTFNVAISPKENKLFAQQICANNGEYFKMLGNIDVRRSESYFSADRDRIFTVVESLEGGLNGVNVLVVSKMRDWVIHCLEEMIMISKQQQEQQQGKAVGDVGEDLEGGIFDKELALGHLLYQQSQYDDSMEIYSVLEGKLIAAITPTPTPTATPASAPEPEPEVVVGKGKGGDKGKDKAKGRLAKCHFQMAQVLYGQRRFTEALVLFERALPVMVSSLGENHPDIGAMYNSIAIIYRNTDRFEAAKEWYERALAVYILNYGEENEDVAMIYHGISIMHLFMGDTLKAVEFDDIALVLFLKTIGPSHPTTARVYNNMGNLYKKTGDYVRSLENFTLALEIKRVALGPDHHAVATTLNNMAEVYLKQGLYKDYLDLAREELRIKLKALGEEHSETVAVTDSIATAEAKVLEQEKKEGDRDGEGQPTKKQRT